MQADKRKIFLTPFLFHREMAAGRKYFSDDIVYQEAGVSEITGRMKWTQPGCL